MQCMRVCVFSDNTAGLVNRRAGFRRMEKSVYEVPVVVEDSGFPIQSSTGTLSVRVCACDVSGSVLNCSTKAFLLPLGLSPGALLAILLCVIILLGKARSPHTHAGLRDGLTDS